MNPIRIVCESDSWSVHLVADELIVTGFTTEAACGEFIAAWLRGMVGAAQENQTAKVMEMLKATAAGRTVN